MRDSLADPSFSLALKYQEISVICDGGSHLSDEIINSWFYEQRMHSSLFPFFPSVHVLLL